MGELPPDSPEHITWLCQDCIKQRGYRLPSLGSVRYTITRCTPCSSYGPCWDIEDLLAAWEDDVVDQ